jgi:hypothetical protein
MKNKITARITFYFKGEKLDFSTEIDLDAWIKNRHADISDIYDAIALSNGIDAYKYEYDVMIMEPIIFSNATGLAAQYLNDTDFDLEGFQAAYHTQQMMRVLTPIAQTYLDIDNLDTQPNIKTALEKAYLAGMAKQQ